MKKSDAVVLISEIRELDIPLGALMELVKALEGKATDPPELKSELEKIAGDMCWWRYQVMELVASISKGINIDELDSPGLPRKGNFPSTWRS